MQTLSMKLEDEQNAVSKLQRAVKEDEARIAVGLFENLKLPPSLKFKCLMRRTCCRSWPTRRRRAADPRGALAMILVLVDSKEQRIRRKFEETRRISEA